MLVPVSFYFAVGITKFLDVTGTISKCSLSYLPTSTCPQARDKKVLRSAKYD